ncbi:MAG: hypothetical protein RLO50_13565 [Azospirillaceae bacterium]
MRPRRRLALLAVLASVAGAGMTANAQHAPLPEPEDGWSAVRLTIENAITPGDALACQVILAHWFEIGVGPIEHGDTARLDLLVRPRSGDVAILNTPGDRMRVERIACGRQESPRMTWREPSLDDLRRLTQATTLLCTDDVACRFVP